MEPNKRPEFLKQVIENLKMERVILVSPTYSGSFSMPFIMENPKFLYGFVAVAPIETSVYTKEDYQKIQVYLKIVIFKIFITCIQLLDANLDNFRL